MTPVVAHHGPSSDGPGVCLCLHDSILELIEKHDSRATIAARTQPLRRGLISGPGTIPALSGTCRVPPPPSSRPSAPTGTAILEQVRSLGAIRKKASSNGTFDPAGSSGTSVNTANATSVHRPSPSTTGYAEATSSRPSSTALFRARDFVRSPEKQVSPTPQYDVSPIVSADIVFSFMSRTVQIRRPMSPSS